MNLSSAGSTEDRFFKAFHNSLVAMAIVCATNHRFLEVNQRFEQLTGYDREELLGRGVDELGLFSTNFQQFFEQLEEQGVVREKETTLQCKDATKKEILLSAVSIELGRDLCWLLNLMDITEREQVESALLSHRNALALEVQQRIADMEAFVFAVSHDLRSPLTTIQGLAQALLEDYGERLNEKGQEFCLRIIQVTHRMDMLISALLDYGRLTYRDLPLEAVDLEKALTDALQLLSIPLTQKKAQVEVVCPLPTVIAHPGVLVQVLTNLISNAIKFVLSGHTPTVRIWAEEFGDRVRLWVEDNGIGIAREHLHRLFHPFSRLHTEQEYPGVGMGLAIVRRGVERMGGTVGVLSEPSKGSRFWIELPKSPSPTLN